MIGRRQGQPPFEWVKELEYHDKYERVGIFGGASERIARLFIRVLADSGLDRNAPAILSTDESPFRRPYSVGASIALDPSAWK